MRRYDQEKFRYESDMGALTRDMERAWTASDPLGEEDRIWEAMNRVLARWNAVKALRENMYPIPGTWQSLL